MQNYLIAINQQCSILSSNIHFASRVDPEQAALIDFKCICKGVEKAYNVYVRLSVGRPNGFRPINQECKSETSYSDWVRLVDDLYCFSGHQVKSQGHSSLQFKTFVISFSRMLWAMTVKLSTVIWHDQLMIQVFQVTRSKVKVTAAFIKNSLR